MSPLTDFSLNRLIPALQRGDFSSRELTQAYLDKIKRLEPVLGAFITVSGEKALEQADSSDKKFDEFRRGDVQDISPLNGIPIAIKDVLVTKNIRSTAGSRILETFIPPYNAAAVEHLVNAGMVIIGKTNTDEFAMGSSTENSAYKTSHNPWRTSHVPGGSSGGSAAAVAARLIPAALGTDTGGSIRQPASFCGVTGLKPTYGRVSRYGLIAFGSSLDCVGVLAQSALDCAAVFQVIAGHDDRDATSAKAPIGPINMDASFSLNGLRVGIPQEYFIDGMQPEVEHAVRSTLRYFEEEGAELIDVSLPHTDYAIPVYYLIAPAEASANLARFDGVRYGPRAISDAMWDGFRKTRGDHFGREVKRRIMLGTHALSSGYYDAYYGKAQKVRTLIRHDFSTVFEQVDVIASPVSPTTAFKIGCHHGDPLSMYLEDIFTIPANLAGIPGTAFPIGFDKDEMPIGIQLMAPHFQEEVLLKVAHYYQSKTNWHQRTPETQKN